MARRILNLTLVLILVHVATASAQPQFTVELLQSPAEGGVAYDITDVGTVAGHVYDNGTYAVVWNGKKPTPLGLVSAATFGGGERPLGMSDSGKGFFNAGPNGYLFTVKGTLTALTEVPNAALGGINDAGHYAGTANGVATLWDGSLVTQLPAASAGLGLNNVDVVTGWVDLGAATAFRWQSDGDFSQVEILPSPAGAGASAGYAINDFGHVAGTSAINGVNRAVAWFGSQVVQLPALPNSVNSRAWDINIDGWIVGEDASAAAGPRATIWIDGTAYDLSTLVVGTNPFQRLTTAFGINDRGDIVGAGRVNGVERPFVLRLRRASRSK